VGNFGDEAAIFEIPLLVRAVFGGLESTRYCLGLVMIDDRRCDVDVSVRASVWKATFLYNTRYVWNLPTYLTFGYNNNGLRFTSC
jgi:hypothetical protein